MKSEEIVKAIQAYGTVMSDYGVRVERSRQLRDPRLIGGEMEEAGKLLMEARAILRDLEKDLKVALNEEMRPG